MNAEFFALAFVAALNPKLLGIDLLLIENRRPRAMFLCVLLGGMTVALTIGLLDVLVFHAEAINSQKTVARASTWPSACCWSPPARWSQPTGCTAGARQQSRPATGSRRKSIPWDGALSQRAEQHLQRMEGAALRVMAGAFRDLDAAGFDPGGDLLGCVQDLEMTSPVGMVDPPREESKAAVASAQQAHIRVRMVTGDDVVTGAAIAKQLNIPGEAILGADFAALPEAERLERIDHIGVVGRVAPEHKVLLAETLKKKGHVVAMTGDGVNDAPAIKAADIGVAMGSGTEVAKNAGRMILSDDNFATIVYAVEQGRKLYDNLNKYSRFVPPCDSSAVSCRPPILVIVTPWPPRISS